MRNGVGLRSLRDTARSAFAAPAFRLVAALPVLFGRNVLPLHFLEVGEIDLRSHSIGLL